MNPIAYINVEERKLEWAEPITWHTPTIAKMDKVPLYTQEQLEEARKLGMQQERALWNLSESTREIMNTQPADLKDEEIVKLYEETSFFGVLDPVKFARAILKKAQEK